jgi:hypothetical protein
MNAAAPNGTEVSLGSSTSRSSLFHVAIARGAVDAKTGLGQFLCQASCALSAASVGVGSFQRGVSCVMHVG